MVSRWQAWNCLQQAPSAKVSIVDGRDLKTAGDQGMIMQVISQMNAWRDGMRLTSIPPDRLV